ncbi:MAG TPA: DUF2382 domain-containing protein [Rubrobacter sp.]
MAQQPAVHIELRDGAWVVVREGNQRATSIHPTQSEAAESGRELARRAGAEFFLHGQDGQIREHRDYREGQTPENEGVLGTALGTVGTVTDAADGITSTATQALGADARQETGTETTAAREREPATGSDRVTRETREVGVLSEAESGVTPEQRYADYEVYDQHGVRIGPISDLFVDDTDEPEYVGVEPGSITNRSVLVPAEVIEIDDQLRRMVVSRPITVVETAPSLGYDDEVTPDFERRVRLHYALPITRGVEGTTPGGVSTEGVSTEGGTTEGRTADLGLTGVGGEEPSSDVAGREDDEISVRRSEEEILVGRREREAGAMRVRKRVRTERERIEVPRKRTEVTVERVPVEEGATSGGEIAATPQIGEEEIVVPIVEEEVVVEKRPVVKEEIRIRKQVVEDVEVVEEDVRKEEIEIEDQTHRDTDL